MRNSTLLLVSELLVFGVASGESLSSEHALTDFLADGGQIAVEGSPGAAALLLADVIRVGPAGDHHAAEEQGQVPIAVVVERVGLVPVGELASVLVGERRLVANFHVARDPTKAREGSGQDSWAE